MSERKIPLVMPIQYQLSELRGAGAESFGRFLLATHYSLVPDVFEEALGNSIALTNDEIGDGRNKKIDNYWSRVSHNLLGSKLGSEFESFCALTYGRAISKVKSWISINNEHQAATDLVKDWEREHGIWLSGTARVNEKDQASGLIIIKNPIIEKPEFAARYPFYEVARDRIIQIAQISTRVKIAAEVNCGLAIVAEDAHVFPDTRQHLLGRAALEALCQDPKIISRISEIAQAA